MLNLVPGVSRTTLAMARRRELPGWFAHVDERRSLPVRAELTVAGVVIAAILVLGHVLSLRTSAQLHMDPFCSLWVAGFVLLLCMLSLFSPSHYQAS